MSCESQTVVKAALRSVHGTQKIETEISGYYLADEIQGTYRGMMIAIPQQEWHIFKDMTFIQLSSVLKYLASLVKLRAFRRHPRGSKKAQPKRIFLKNQPHVSTALTTRSDKKRTSNTLKGLVLHI